jgi:cathepsin E
MVATSFLSTLLLALTVVAKPVERRASLAELPFIKLVTGGNICKLDQLRAKLFKEIGLPDIFGPGIASSPAENRAVSYIATVGVGSPPTNCKLIAAIGS